VGGGNLYTDQTQNLLNESPVSYPESVWSPGMLQGPPKHWCLSIRLHSATYQKTVVILNFLKATIPQNVTLHTLVDIYQCFEGTYCLHPQDRIISKASNKQSAVHSSKMSINFYQTTQHHISEDGTPHDH
jgi:hypothetical protein